MTVDPISLDTIVKFCRRKGFVYPSSEIYGGFAATYDYGQMGMMLKKNLETAWRHWNVITRTDMLEIEGAIFMHPKVWAASGHIGGFSDLLVEDTISRKRYRADQLIEDAGIMDNAGSLSPEQVDDLIQKNNLKSPDGNPFGPAKKFNLLVKTHLGPIEDDSSVAYLKGESCQNIYLNWKVVQETSRKKLPFGIAQIGKAFRNEITVKQFLFRTREFEQMDIQYFCKPAEADVWYEYWKENRWNFYTKFLGFSESNLNYRQHEPNERAFYAKDAWDIEYRFGVMGLKEIEGLHHRGSYDLDQHSKHSGVELGYLDPETNERANPFIVECSGGFNRLFLATLFEFYKEEVLKEEGKEDETRVLLALPYDLAPYKIAILPLMKKDGMSEKATQIFENLRLKGILADYDEAGSIGKRYRRQDENGTPWCLTLDYESMSDNIDGLTDNSTGGIATATLRHRDSMKQIRIPISEIADIEKYLNAEVFEGSLENVGLE